MCWLKQVLRDPHDGGHLLLHRFHRPAHTALVDCRKLITADHAEGFEVRGVDQLAGLIAPLACCWAAGVGRAAVAAAGSASILGLLVEVLAGCLVLRCQRLGPASRRPVAGVGIGLGQPASLPAGVPACFRC